MIINAYSTIRQAESPAFAASVHNVRDQADPELAPHLQGFLGYISKFSGESMTTTTWYLLGHIERVRVNYSFDADLDKDGAELAAWCERTNSVYFLPDGTVRDPQGRVLLSQIPGEIDTEAKVPWPSEAWARKAATEDALEGRNLPSPAILPPVISDREVVLRTPAEVAARLQALFVVATRADHQVRRQTFPLQAVREAFPTGFAALSPEEAGFMQADGKLFGPAAGS